MNSRKFWIAIVAVPLLYPAVPAAAAASSAVVEVSGSQRPANAVEPASRFFAQFDTGPVANPVRLAALERQCVKRSRTGKFPDLRLGVRHRMVLKVHKLLRVSKSGYVVTAQTQDAVRGLQEALGRRATGVLTQVDWCMLSGLDSVWSPTDRRQLTRLVVTFLNGPASSVEGATSADYWREDVAIGPLAAATLVSDAKQLRSRVSVLTRLLRAGKSARATLGMVVAARTLYHDQVAWLAGNERVHAAASLYRWMDMRVLGAFEVVDTKAQLAHWRAVLAEYKGRPAADPDEVAVMEVWLSWGESNYAKQLRIAQRLFQKVAESHRLPVKSQQRSLERMSMFHDSVPGWDFTLLVANFDDFEKGRSVKYVYLPGQCKGWYLCEPV